MGLNIRTPELTEGFMEETGSTVLRNARVDTASTAGEVVKLDSYSGGIIVTPITATTDAIYGTIPFTPKTDAFAINDVVRVVVANAIIVKTASEAITVGALLEIDPSTMKVAIQNTGTLYGTALQVATEDGDLIKVEMGR